MSLACLPFEFGFKSRLLPHHMQPGFTGCSFNGAWTLIAAVADQAGWRLHCSSAKLKLLTWRSLSPLRCPDSCSVIAYSSCCQCRRRSPVLLSVTELSLIPPLPSVDIDSSPRQLLSSPSLLGHHPPAMSVIVPLFCHRPHALSSAPCSVIVPLLCHRPRGGAITDPLALSLLLCRHPPVLSSSPLLCHRPRVLSLSPPCSIVVPALSSPQFSVIVTALSPSPCISRRKAALKLSICSLVKTWSCDGNYPEVDNLFKMAPRFRTHGVVLSRWTKERE